MTKAAASLIASTASRRSPSAGSRRCAAPARRAKQDLLQRQAIARTSLGQQQPLAGPHRLGADQYRGAAKAGAAHAGGEGRRGMATADQHPGCGRCHE
ncbi:MAG TPA: hypothetical protein PLB41_04515 [Rubrivivax sp.]|nr:hypothetical protein [Rubrivivax sp.]